MRLLITIVANRRADRLRMLLQSVQCMSVRGIHSVDMVISQDGEGDPRCADLMRDFAWPHGQCRLVFHAARLGLKEHVLRTGDLVNYYDAIIMLEDDLLVAPTMLEYAFSAIEATSARKYIGQIALYAPRIAEFYGLPFTPICPNGDVWYGRIPCSWGQCWTRPQWQAFRSWLKATPSVNHLGGMRHPAAAWGPQSWKRLYFEYLIERHLWVMYPRSSLTTNSGVPGEHFLKEKRYYQVPLEAGKRAWHFASIEESGACYDEWFEPCPENFQTLKSEAARAHVVCDLYGRRPPPESGGALMLSTRPCRHPIRSFLNELVPAEMNVRLGLEVPMGDGAIHLGSVRDFDPNPASINAFINHTAPKVVKEISRLERSAVGHERFSRRTWTQLVSVVAKCLSRLRKKVDGTRVDHSD